MLAERSINFPVVLQGFCRLRPATVR